MRNFNEPPLSSKMLFHSRLVQIQPQLSLALLTAVSLHPPPCRLLTEETGSLISQKFPCTRAGLQFLRQHFTCSPVMLLPSKLASHHITSRAPGPLSSRRDVKMRPAVHLLLAQASPPALPHSFSSGWEPLPGSVVSLGAAERLRERYHLFCAYQLQLSSKEFSLLRSR